MAGEVTAVHEHVARRDGQPVVEVVRVGDRDDTERPRHGSMIGASPICSYSSGKGPLPSRFGWSLPEEPILEEASLPQELERRLGFEQDIVFRELPLR